MFFAIGNLICGLAKAECVIILGRVLAAVGGGGLTTIATCHIGFGPASPAGHLAGYRDICYGVGSGLGGVFGGLINDTLGWRWLFLIQVPVLVVSHILVMAKVDIPIEETDTARIKRIDFLGAITLVITLVTLLLGLNTGGNQVPWMHPVSPHFAPSVWCSWVFSSTLKPGLPRSLSFPCVSSWTGRLKEPA